MKTQPPAGAIAEDARKTWTSPRLEKIPAGDAEAGPTPIGPEGPFGTGS